MSCAHRVHLGPSASKPVARVLVKRVHVCPAVQFRLLTLFASRATTEAADPPGRRGDLLWRVKR
jgi:hypothetical protein